MYGFWRYFRHEVDKLVEIITMIPEVLEIIEKYDLGDVVRWILNNNPSQALPYHNLIIAFGSPIMQTKLIAMRALAPTLQRY